MWRCSGSGAARGGPPPPWTLRGALLHCRGREGRGSPQVDAFVAAPLRVRGACVPCVRRQVRLTPSRRDTGLVAAYTFEPLSNLVFTRDQQITTLKVRAAVAGAPPSSHTRLSGISAPPGRPRALRSMPPLAPQGVVMGRLRSAQRQREVQVMRFCLQKLALDIVGEVREPGFLEGGDFVPISADLAMVRVWGPLRLAGVPLPALRCSGGRATDVPRGPRHTFPLCRRRERPPCRWASASAPTPPPAPSSWTRTSSGRAGEYH